MSRTVSRRRLVSASACGAVLGSSWALSLRRVASGRQTPTAIVVHNDRSLAMLVEYKQARLLVLDCDTEDSTSELTETGAGFMTPRIDLLLASGRTMDSLPSGFLNRWNVEHIYELPTPHRSTSRSGFHRAFSVEAMRVVAGSRPMRQWQRSGEERRSEWHVRVMYRSSQIVLATSLETAAEAATQQPAKATYLISNDISPSPSAFRSARIALPAESAGLENILPDDPGVVRLYRNRPTLFRLTPAGIETPRVL